MDLAFQGHTFKLKSKKMSGVKEYGPILGRFLSLLRLAFKTFDSRGKSLYINRKSFCRWLLDQENEERIQHVSRQAFYHVLKPASKHLVKKTSRLELSNVVRIFNREMGKLQQSMGGHLPDLHTLYGVLKEELQSN